MSNLILPQKPDNHNYINDILYETLRYNILLKLTSTKQRSSIIMFDTIKLFLMSALAVYDHTQIINEKELFIDAVKNFKEKCIDILLIDIEYNLNILRPIIKDIVYNTQDETEKELIKKFSLLIGTQSQIIEYINNCYNYQYFKNEILPICYYLM